jgi:hypothetical protein
MRQVCRIYKAQRVEMWLTTANSLQRSRCGEIGAPLVKKAKLISLSADHATHVNPHISQNSCCQRG